MENLRTRPAIEQFVAHALSARKNPTLQNLSGNADSQRAEIQALLHAQPHLIVERQYPHLRAVLQKFDLIDMSGQPHKGGCALPEPPVVAESFAADQLQLSFSPQFRNPTLLLIPDSRFLHLVSSVNAHGLPGQNLTLLEKFPAEDGKNERIEGWTPIIVEGAKGPKYGTIGHKPMSDEVLATFIQRVWNQRAAVSSNLRGIDRYVYIMLMMDAMANAKGDIKNLPDRSNSSILDEDVALNLQEECYPIGKYRRFDEQNSEFQYEDAVSFYISGQFSKIGGHWMRNAVVGHKITA